MVSTETEDEDNDEDDQGARPATLAKEATPPATLRRPEARVAKEYHGKNVDDVATDATAAIADHEHANTSRGADAHSRRLSKNQRLSTVLDFTELINKASRSGSGKDREASPSGSAAAAGGTERGAVAEEPTLTRTLTLPLQHKTRTASLAFDQRAAYVEPSPEEVQPDAGSVRTASAAPVDDTVARLQRLVVLSAERARTPGSASAEKT
jgi:hypothetical protein